MSSVRRSSSCVMKYWRRSAMVAPGMTPTPPTMTLVGIPSVCESTAWKTRRARIRSALRRAPSRSPGGRRGLLLGRRARAAAGSGRRRSRPDMSIDSLIAWTNSVFESQRSSGCSSRYSGEARSRGRRRAARGTARRRIAGRRWGSRRPSRARRRARTPGRESSEPIEHVEPRCDLGDLVRPARHRR